jgi:hypothetical protein
MPSRLPPKAALTRNKVFQFEPGQYSVFEILDGLALVQAAKMRDVRLGQRVSLVVNVQRHDKRGLANGHLVFRRSLRLEHRVNRFGKSGCHSETLGSLGLIRMDEVADLE